MIRPLPPFSSMTATPDCRNASRYSSANAKLQFLRALFLISMQDIISLLSNLRSNSRIYSLNLVKLTNVTFLHIMPSPCNLLTNY